VIYFVCLCHDISYLVLIRSKKFLRAPLIVLSKNTFVIILVIFIMDIEHGLFNDISVLVALSARRTVLGSEGLSTECRVTRVAGQVPMIYLLIDQDMNLLLISLRNNMNIMFFLT